MLNCLNALNNHCDFMKIGYNTYNPIKATCMAMSMSVTKLVEETMIAVYCIMHHIYNTLL